ncbi:MAG TPA: SpoIIE family protein phosphatase [Roseiflexaceae bacterium]|nr:SpoIIE family protein phosphatase [Roseiflexaceae bacterium]
MAEYAATQGSFPRVTITWGAVCRAKHGQQVAGDVFVAAQAPAGGFITAVIDGLGGGIEAARAATAAEQVIAGAPDLPLQDLLRRSHSALQGTRGAVIGLLRLDPHALRVSYVGVGNVGVHAYSRRPIKPISKNGILGYRLPTLLEMHYVYDPGDLFVLYSDGVSSQFVHDTAIDLAQLPDTLANQILAGYGKQNDDATVVVVRTSLPS